jgi:hypothetical protein
MWLCPVNEMTKLVSGMPAPQAEGESSPERVQEPVQASSTSIKCFLVLTGVSVPQVKDHYCKGIIPQNTTVSVIRSLDKFDCKCSGNVSSLL